MEHTTRQQDAACSKPVTENALLALQTSHTPEAIRERLFSGPRESHLRDVVYGAIDGTVTTFAVVSGVAGAGLASGIVVVLGVANLIGDGFSMAAGNFLGTRAEEQHRQKMRRTEEMHIRVYPAGEREEIRQLFSGKGFEGQDLDHIVNVITADKKRWVDTMLQQEHGMSLKTPSAWRAALATLLAFVGFGSIPLLPFGFNLAFVVPRPYVTSTVLTALTFFLVGAFKGRFVEEKWYRSGFETLLIGGTAAGLAYFVGILLQGLA